jgi:hypothetical protein
VAYLCHPATGRTNGFPYPITGKVPLAAARQRKLDQRPAARRPQEKPICELVVLNHPDGRTRKRTDDQLGKLRAPSV